MYPVISSNEKNSSSSFLNEECKKNATEDVYNYPTQSEKAICRLAGNAFSSRSVFNIYEELENNNDKNIDSIDWKLKVARLKSELEDIQSSRSCVTVYTGSRGFSAQKVAYAVVNCIPGISTSKLSNIFSKSDSKSISEINEKLLELRKSSIKKLKHVSMAVAEVFGISNPNFLECCITDNIFIETNNKEENLPMIVVKRNMCDERFNESQENERFYQLFNKDTLVVYRSYNPLNYKNNWKRETVGSEGVYGQMIPNSDLQKEGEAEEYSNKTPYYSDLEMQYLNSNENGFWKTNQDDDDYQKENQGYDNLNHRCCNEYVCGKSLVEMDYIESEKYIRRLAELYSLPKTELPKNSLKETSQKKNNDKSRTTLNPNKRVTSDDSDIKTKNTKRWMTLFTGGANYHKKSKNENDKENTNKKKNDTEWREDNKKNDEYSVGIHKVIEGKKLELVYQKQFTNQDKSCISEIARSISCSDKERQYSFSLRRIIEIDNSCV